MSERKIHCLNVGQGDSFILERDSGRVTIIDICCGNLDIKKVAEAKYVKPPGDYGMRDKPTNPVDYLTSKGISEIWRFILTHPDMDHMDGIKRLFAQKTVSHFWDCGIRKKKPDFSGGIYLEEDWDYYEDLINGKVTSTKVISPRAGDNGKFWNCDNDDGNGQGDCIAIIAPNKELVDSANEIGDGNDASYVIVYRSTAGPVIFAGDSHDKTWEYILKHHKDIVQNAAVLFAPHHGRKSAPRDFSFLDIVNPRISFFGCAPSEHLAYGAWNSRDLLFFTNNQCGNIHVYPVAEDIQVFIENYNYAKDYTGGETYAKDGYWFLCQLPKQNKEIVNGNRVQAILRNRQA